MAIRAFTVLLEDDQIELLGELREQVAGAAKAGHPGMALAQIFFSAQQIKAFFVTEEQAREFQRIMGSPVGLTTKGRERAMESGSADAETVES